MSIGPWEIAIVIVIAMVVFASSLPKLGRMLGSAVFKARNEFGGKAKDETSNRLPDNLS